MRAPNPAEWREHFRSGGWRIDRDLEAEGTTVGFVAAWDVPFSLRSLTVAVATGLSVVEDVERFIEALRRDPGCNLRLFVTERPGLVSRPCATLEIRAVDPKSLSRVPARVPGMPDLVRSTGLEAMQLPMLPGPVPLRVERAGMRGLDGNRIAEIRAAMRADGAPRAVCFVEEVDPQTERLAAAQGIDLVPEAFPAGISYRQHELMRKVFVHVFLTWPCSACKRNEACGIEIELGDTDARLRRGTEQVVYFPTEIRPDEIPSFEMRYGRPLTLVVPALPPGVPGYSILEDRVVDGEGDLLQAVVRRVQSHPETVLKATGLHHEGPQRASRTECGRYRTVEGGDREGVLLVPGYGRGDPRWLRIRNRTPRYYVLSAEAARAGDTDPPLTGAYRRSVQTGRDSRFELLDLYPGNGTPIRFRIVEGERGELRAYLREPIRDVGDGPGPSA